MNTESNNTTSNNRQVPEFYYVKNWRKFQHYKGRNPPWVKLHTNIFRSKDWIRWTDTQRLTALCCLLVASMYDGCVPNDPILIKRLCHMDWRIDLQPLINSGFLTENASDTLADASNLQQKSSLETETEIERKKEKKESKIPPSAVSSNQAVEEGYAYESGVIKLRQKDLDRWKQAFPELSLQAELEALAGWDKLNGKNWFVAVANALAKKNRDALERKSAIKVGVEAGIKPASKPYYSV